LPDDWGGAFEPPVAEAEAALEVSVDGFEGPLDLLLTLAKAQKVDLRRVSVLQLAERYLAFVAEAERLRIELAADYLVMAAWLAFLKSRLLLPPPHEDGGPSGEDMAARLAWRLERLEAMRRVAARLMARDRLGLQTFARGAPEAERARRVPEWRAGLADLLAAYARVASRRSYRPLHLRRAPVLALEEAYERLVRALGGPAPDWRALARFLPSEWRDTAERRRSALASTFAATLELAKRGRLELAQDRAFAPLRLRPRG
jgi:segregation and condensation protein A